MQIHNFATHVRSLSCTYQSDINFNLKKSVNTNQQGMNFVMHDAMRGAQDAAINNFSSLVLTDQKTTQDVFELSIKETSNKKSISTYLAISYTGEIDDSAKYLYFNGERETDSTNFSNYTSHEMLSEADILYEDQRYFNIELIDAQHARINFKYNNRDYYLAANNQREIMFVSGSQYKSFKDLTFNFIDETTFFYTLDLANNTICLQKPLTGNRTFGLGLSELNTTKLQLLSASSSINYFTTDPFIFIVRPTITDSAINLNTSWVAYDPDNIENLPINSAVEDLHNNMLIISQYADATDSGVPTRPIMLKNQHSLLSYADQCSYTELHNNKPGNQIRQYTSLLTGNEQERGNDSIALNYTIYANDYMVKPDSYNLFKTSSDLYPYARLNVNDTTLVADGALGGNSPYTSDQLFMQKNDEQGKDGQYLCTWLSGGTWLDRYYNNNKMSPADAAKAVNIVYGEYKDYVSLLLQNNQLNYDFFDKKSDFVFEPDTEYFYYRMGNKRVDQQLQTYSTALLLSSLDWRTSRGNLVDETIDEYVCIGSNYATFNEYEPINEAGQLTFSMWMESSDWSNIQAHEIVGNVTGTGFGFIKDPVVTPFITIQSLTAVHIFNSDFVEISRTIIPNAIFVARAEALDDYYAINNNGTIYEMQADGTLYNKTLFYNNIISVANNEQIIYSLSADGVTVNSFDAFTRQTSSFSLQESASSIVCIDGQVYGFKGTKAIPFTTDSVLFLYNQNQIVYENYATGDQNVAFSTLSSTSAVGFISDFALDEDLSIYIVHDDYKLSKYSTDKTLLFTTRMNMPLSAICLLDSAAVDVCYEYINGVKQKSIVVAFADANNEVVFFKLSDDGEVLKRVQTNVGKLPKSKFNLTNAQYLLHKHANRGNVIDFVVKLRNFYNNLDIKTVRSAIDLTKLCPGAHHLAFRIDAVQGNVTLFVDGQLKYNEYIGAAKYMHLPLLQTSICYGATQFNNGAILSKYLKQKNAFFANGVTISYPRIYNASLQDNDIKLLYMQRNKVKDLTFHLPCGHRNNIDTVKQTFAWGTPGHKSSDISIKIKNSGIATTSMQQAIKNEILQEIKHVLPVNVNILDIEFVEFD